MTNPWTERFRELNVEDVAARFGHRPSSVDPKQYDNRHALFSATKAALDSIAIATLQTVQACARVYAQSAMHAYSVYTDEKAFLRNCYRSEGPELPENTFPICLTGLAGIGKSTLLRRLPSVLPEQSSVAVDRGARAFPLIASWHLSVKELRTLKAMLQHLIRQSGATPSGKTVDELTRQCRRIAYQCGVTMLTVDELQFLTKSAIATAKIYEIIYGLMAIGLPITISANYSLLHKLKTRRNSEDKQRLFSDTQVILPEPIDSDDWASIVEGFRAISPSMFVFEAESNAKTLHNWTAGTPRLVSQLIQIAIEQSPYSTPRIGMDELLLAFESAQYSVNRDDVAIINQQFATGIKVRDDLWCPVTIPESVDAAQRAEAKESARAEIAAKAIENSLSQGQLDLLNHFRAQARSQDCDSNVVPIGEKGKPTLQDFDEGEELLEKIRGTRR
jgi:energy-coupling factor transporter ATP-binding protein EcfA2